MNIRKLSLKESLGVKFNSIIDFKMTGIFVLLLSQDTFESNCSETKFRAITSQSQFEKVTVQKSIVELRTVISNQMISISNSIRGFIKYVIINMTYTCMESYPLSYQRMQLIKILSSCLRKLNGCFFLNYGFRSDCLEK